MREQRLCLSVESQLIALLHLGTTSLKGWHCGKRLLEITMLKSKKFLEFCAILLSIIFSQAAYAEKVIPGAVCSVQSHKLSTEIEWYKSLSKAKDAAQQEGKLIVWIHMVGKIDGAT